jgi:hypothetical protein
MGEVIELSVQVHACLGRRLPRIEYIAFVKAMDDVISSRDTARFVIHPPRSFSPAFCRPTGWLLSV